MVARDREFDFWLGDWGVSDASGELAGRNRIRLTAGGRGLREEWRGSSRLRGTRLNSWSESRQRWHQTWMDSGGTLLLLDGGIRDDAMVMEGTGTASMGNSWLGFELAERLTASATEQPEAASLRATETSELAVLATGGRGRRPDCGTRPRGDPSGGSGVFVKLTEVPTTDVR